MGSSLVNQGIILCQQKRQPMHFCLISTSVFFFCRHWALINDKEKQRRQCYFRLFTRLIPNVSLFLSCVEMLRPQKPELSRSHSQELAVSKNSVKYLKNHRLEFKLISNCPVYICHLFRFTSSFCFGLNVLQVWVKVSAVVCNIWVIGKDECHFLLCWKTNMK